MAVVGDIFPGGRLYYQNEYITTELMQYLDSFDIRVGNLESAIGDNIDYERVKMAGAKNLIYSHNADLLKVKGMGFDVVSLANNHIYDLGEEGLKNTIYKLKELGIQYCGAGLNIEEAERPAVINVKGKSFAFIGCCMAHNSWMGYVKRATSNEPGVNVLDVDRIKECIHKAKLMYDYVVVIPHWGAEYYHMAAPGIYNMAKDIFNAGADAIIGGHPHVINPWLRYKGRPLFLSLGNFLFPDFFINKPRPLWYPDANQNLDSYKKVSYFPQVVDEPSEQIWGKHMRIGMVSQLSFRNDKIKASYKLVRLSPHNVLDLYENILYRLQYWFRGLFSKVKVGYTLLWKISSVSENPISKIVKYIMRKTRIINVK